MLHQNTRPPKTDQTLSTADYLRRLNRRKGSPFSQKGPQNPVENGDGGIPILTGSPKIYDTGLGRSNVSSVIHTVYCIVIFDPVGNEATPYSTDAATVQRQIANDVKGI